jgi:hypothetical protein
MSGYAAILCYRRLMNNVRAGLACLLILAFAAGALAQHAAITAESLRTWLTYISSDQLEGRATFSEGIGLAAGYIADQLKAAGVKPNGDNGTYFQRVSVLGVRSTSHSSVTVEVNGSSRTFEDGDGVSFPKNVGGRRTVTLSDIEFVGYGVNLNSSHNDYKDVNPKGKAVVWLGNRGPKGADAAEAARLIRGRASFAIEEMGAAAAIGPARQQPDGPQDRGGSPAARRGAAEQPDFTTVQRLDSPQTPSITAADEFFEFLFSDADAKYSELQAKAERQEDLPEFALKGVKLTFNLAADYHVVSTRYTRNVVGLVEGNDPHLKNTYVAFGAHYDHIGYMQGPFENDETDRIANGADDDGSGTAALIGIARAFAQGRKTKRSELFVWHSGEELGQYGSRYFADYPLMPMANIAAQINMDMIGRNRDNKDTEANTVYPVGSDRISTELHNIMIDANAALPKPLAFDYQLNDPTDPERVYYRSDHYSYAAKGVPIIFFTTNLHPDYHRVSDSVEKINFEKMTRIAQLVYETGRRLANMDHAPIRDFKGPRLGKGAAGKITSN